MKTRSVLTTTLVATVVALSCLAPAHAQRPGGVAIVDTRYIFKNHTRFQQLKKQLDGEVQNAQSAMTAKQNDIVQMRDRLKDFNAGTPEFDNIDTTILQRTSELQADVAIQKKEFFQKEAKIYFDVYQEVLAAIRSYAQQNGISLVIRFSNDPADAGDPQSVLRELNKNVVYYEQTIDITGAVLAQLNNTGGHGLPAGGGIPQRSTALPQRQPVGAPQGTLPRPR
ncbi:MAG: OmpH family outer membrane protein [Planctomycetales bacterium]|nr:OmpH family outer membrane protein [Planctomycetales bacterium]